MLLTTLCWLVAAFIRWNLRWPYGTADAVNIWTTRAKFLFLSNQPFGDVLQALDRGNPDYPLLVPASIAGQAALWDSWELAIPQATAAFFLVGLAAMIYVGMVRSRVGPLAIPAVALVLASPVIGRWGFSQGADVPMAYLTLAAAVGLASHLTPSTSPLPPYLVGFCLGLIPWTKYEGSILFVILASTFSILWLSRRRFSWADVQPLVKIAAGAVPGLLGTLLFTLSWAPRVNADRFLGSSVWEKLASLERWTTAMTEVLEVVGPLNESSMWTWNLPFLFIAAILLIRWRGFADRSRVFMGVSIALIFLAYITVYVITPLNQEHHILKSIDRLLLHLYPLAAVWIFSFASMYWARRQTGNTSDL